MLLACLAGLVNNNINIVDRKKNNNSEVDASNIIHITMEDLNDAQKEQIEKAMEDYNHAYLQSFSSTTRGKAIVDGS